MATDKELQVKNFLISVKLTLQRHSSKRPSWTFSTIRQKNMDTLAKLEMKVDDVREVIRTLKTTDYLRGPFKDKSITGDLWEFGKKN